jgi:hypothetical protein
MSGKGRFVALLILLVARPDMSAATGLEVDGTGVSVRVSMPARWRVARERLVRHPFRGFGSIFVAIRSPVELHPLVRSAPDPDVTLSIGFQKKKMDLDGQVDESTARAMEEWFTGEEKRDPRSRTEKLDVQHGALDMDGALLFVPGVKYTYNTIINPGARAISFVRISLTTKRTATREQLQALSSTVGSIEPSIQYRVAEPLPGVNSP